MTSRQLDEISGFAAGSRATDWRWWQQAVVYQIYPRSFADSDGDGIGDIRGITSRIPYLAALGVDAVWLSPFYPSALSDGGYDVDDYRDVDPRLGTLEDLDVMIAMLHEVGIKVVIDIVPNHTSNRHEWFRQAVAAAPGSPERERYVFRDGTGVRGDSPPSDWQSVFNGPAWTQVPDGQWYLHLFTPEQPDLNWANPEVHDDFLRTLRFWGDRGVDGFRVDVAHGLAKDLTEPLAPARWPHDELPDDGSHPLWDRDEVHDIYREWRRVFNEYDPPLTAVAEAWVPPTRLARYASSDGLGQAFNFDLLRAAFDPIQFRSVIDEHLTRCREDGSSSTWVLSNHDVVRHATRYGWNAAVGGAEFLSHGAASADLDRTLGIRRAMAATMLILALPGAAYLYQGEELGLHEVCDLPASAIQDPVFRRSGGRDLGRDGCRVPLPWATDGPSYGFGTTVAHLPQPEWFALASVEAEQANPVSPLNLYRAAITWRRRLRTSERLDWVDDGPESVLHFRRPGGWHCVTNFGPGPVPLPGGTPVLASAPLLGDQLPPSTTAWLLEAGR